VPGGLGDFVSCQGIAAIEYAICERAVESGATWVSSRTELAGAASAIGVNGFNLIIGSGTAISLPIKIKLENPLLGGDCYIGSNAHPIVLNFTTGITKPPAGFAALSGNRGVLTYEDELTYATDNDVRLVENDFAVPAAEGCGGSSLAGLIDGTIDAKAGIPAAPGKSEAILNESIRVASAEAVRRSE
jgi:hypothetical protein